MLSNEPYSMTRMLFLFLQTIALHLDVPPSECKRRVLQRGDDHPTLRGPAAVGVINRFANDFRPVSAHERFNQRWRIQGDGGEAAEQLQAVLLQLGRPMTPVMQQVCNVARNVICTYY